jgi:hypothetical protein
MIKIIFLVAIVLILFYLFVNKADKKNLFIVEPRNIQEHLIYPCTDGKCA